MMCRKIDFLKFASTDMMYKENSNGLILQNHFIATSLPSQSPVDKPYTLAEYVAPNTKKKICPAKSHSTSTTLPNLYVASIIKGYLFSFADIVIAQ
jgi:hypothetical protein